MLTAEGKQWNVELFYSDTAHAHNDRRMPNISTLGIGEKLKFHLFFQNRCNLRITNVEFIRFDVTVEYDAVKALTNNQGA